MKKKLGNSHEQYLTGESRQLRSPEELKIGMRIGIQTLRGLSFHQRMMKSFIELNAMREQEDSLLDWGMVAGNFKKNNPETVKIEPRQTVLVEYIGVSSLSGVAEYSLPAGSKQTISHFSELPKSNITVEHDYDRLGLMPIPDNQPSAGLWMPRAVVFMGYDYERFGLS
jgi:hypothetical protein